MDRLDGMRVFVAVVEAGGFSAAARELGMPVPTVSRKIGDLEDYLGAQLLLRSTRKVSVTEGGQRYYDDARRILEGVEEVERRAAGEHQSVKGLLTVTAPALLGRLHVLPIVTDFMRRHTEIEVRLVLNPRYVDLAEEHVDVAIRVGDLGGGLTALPAGSVRTVTCASPEYLDSHGRPTSPDDIKNHSCITFAPMGLDLPWIFKMPSGRQEEVKVRPKLAFAFAGDATVDAAVAGFGLSQDFSYSAGYHVDAGELEIVLRDFEADPWPVNVVFHRRQFLPQKVRAFADMAAPALAASLAAAARACDA